MRKDLAPLGGTLRSAASAEDLQPANRPVRTSRHYFEHILQLVPLPRLHCFGRECHRRAVSGNVQAVSTAPKGSQLHHRPSHGEDGGLAYRRRTLINLADRLPFEAPARALSVQLRPRLVRLAPPPPDPPAPRSAPDKVPAPSARRIP